MTLSFKKGILLTNTQLLDSMLLCVKPGKLEEKQVNIPPLQKTFNLDIFLNHRLKEVLFTVIYMLFRKKRIYLNNY